MHLEFETKLQGVLHKSLEVTLKTCLMNII